MTKITIDIVSDTICPWCFVGKRRLESAIEEYKSLNPEASFEVKWHPYYLDPTSKIQVKMDRYVQKFGQERMEKMLPYMKNVAKQEGINMEYNGPIGPTQLSHRLINYAGSKSPELQDRVVERLFKEYFEINGNIFEIDPLLKISNELGLDEKEVKSALEGEEGSREVDREVHKNQQRGITGVPFFTINNRLHLSGAQEPSEFLRAFTRITK
ncbi:hypothetical protein AKO1_014766 [Acrasis kona]